MINNVSQIPSTYTQTSIKEDGKDQLPAAEWNAISAAVALAHTKINDIISSSNGDVDITLQQEDAQKTLSITNEYGDTYIYTGGDLFISADGTVSGDNSGYLQITAKSLKFVIDGNEFTGEDLYTVIDYFKDEGRTNGTGPFASLHSNSQS